MQIIGYICGCCNCKISPGMHVSHLKWKAEQQCSRGSIHSLESWFQRFEKDFLKTQVVFDTGLVIFQQNLIVTDLCGYNNFRDLAKQWFESFSSVN